MADYNAIKRELQQLTPASGDVLEKLAIFLKDMTRAWDQASQEQRNRLAKCLLETVWIKDKQVVAVKPQPELEPFFQLNYEEFVNKVLKMRPRGASKPRVILSLETYPVLAPSYLTVPPRTRRKLSPYLWSEIMARHKSESLRQLAKEYGTSREAVRRSLAKARTSNCES